MRNIGLRSPFTQATALAVATAGFFVSVLPAQASFRLRAEDYQTCAGQLVGSGISEADAASACAAAFYPKDVSQCVVSISSETEIAATDALSGCRQVRRPVELASCVSEINTDTTGAVLSEVLENCRRSLLPTRFSACVVGLATQMSLAPAEAMQTCVAAGDRPRNVRPDFIPAGQ